MRFPHIPGKKILRVFSIIGLLISIYFLVGGVICLLRNSTTKDNEGFYTTWNLQIEKDSYAIVMGPKSIYIVPGWDLGDLNTFKVEGLNNDPVNQIFIGVAGESDIDAYLSDVEYDEITDLYIFPTRADYQNHPGSIMPGKPTSQFFWIESTYGTGTQTLNWELEPYRYSLLLMNEDGAADVDMNIVLGAKAPLLFIVGMGNLFGGVVALLISISMFSFSGRSRNIVFPEPLEHLHQQRMKSKTNS